MSAWTPTAADVVICSGPAILHGLVLLTSSDGGDVTLYAGKDTGGRKIGRFEAKSDQSTPVMFDPGLPCENGIYVDVGSNVTEVLILWSPAN